VQRKTLDKRKECGRLFATAREKAPWGVVVGCFKPFSTHLSEALVEWTWNK